MESSPSSNRSTLKDVAARARVSIQTVSNVLNSRGEMTAATRERVEQAMRDLLYVPNVQARGLRSQKTQTIAFLLLDSDPRFLADPMTDLLVAGVGAAARERGHMVLVHAARPENEHDDLLLPLHQNRADGAILLLSGKRQARMDLITLVQGLGSRFVVLEDVDDPGVTTVTADNRDGGYRMTRHLLKAGHTRVAFMGTQTSWPMIEQRFMGYRQALEDGGINFDRTLTRFAGEWTSETGERLISELRKQADPPTALFAGNDLLAIGAIKALKAAGLHVPKDFAVAGFDDFAFAEHTDPALTSVRVPAFEMGFDAATKLIDEIEGINQSPESTVWPVKMMLRESA